MIRAVCVLLACLLVAACSESGAPLVASDIVIKKPMPGMRMSAGYLTLRNDGNAPITITAVTSPQFESVELHETIDEDGISRMTKLPELTIPPASQVELAPGGKHLMLMSPTGPLETVALEFYSGETVVLTVDISPEG